MEQILATYFDADYLNWLLAWIALFPAGIILGCLGWCVSYTVYGLFRLLKQG